MDQIKVKRLVRSLKGSPAQILLAFLFARRAMAVKEIQEWTGLKRETIYQALPALEGLVVLQDTLAHGRDVFAPGGDLLPVFQMLIDFTEDPALEGGNLEKSIGLLDVAEKRTPGPESVAAADLFSGVSSYATTTTTRGQESEKRTPGERAALNLALDEYVIIGKKREDLVRCEWVSAEYVRACVESAKNDRQNFDNPVGFAIMQMLAHVPMPSTRENGHPENCRCGKCQADDFFRVDRSKYLRGLPDYDDEESEEADER